MTGYQLTIYKPGGGILSIHSMGRMVENSRLLDWTENQTASLSFSLANREGGASNFLDSTFNLWEGGSYTGALQLGMRVYYRIVSSVDGSWYDAFWGTITDMSQGTDGVLNVTCSDDMAKMEAISVAKTIFNNYVDDSGQYRDSSGGVYRFGASGLPGDIVWPPVQILNGNNDIEALGTPINMWSTPNSNTGTEWNGVGHKVCQAVAPHDIIGSVRLHYKAGGSNTADVRLSIQSDSSGYPSGTIVGNLSVTVATINTGVWRTNVYGFTSGSCTKLDRAQRYWIVVEPVGDTSVCDVQFGCDDGNSYTYPDHQYYDGSWHSVTGTCLLADVYYVDYDTVTPSTTYYSGGYIYMPSITSPCADAGGAYNAQCRYSAYRGTITLEDIATNLIGLAGFVGYASPNCDRTFGLYRTRGRSIAECLREIADVFETSGPYSGSQHAISVYWDGSAPRCYFLRRLNLNDTSVLTFQHPKDGSTNNVIMSVDLRKMVKMRPSGVIVTGQSGDNKPLVRGYDDRSLGASSFRTNSGIPLTYTEYDESLTTMAEVDARASTRMKSFKRDTWEGRITLSGVYPELRDFGTGDMGTHGSGQIFTLYWSPLGISNQKFKVKGLRFTKYTTEVQVTNNDTLMDNKLTKGMSTAYKSESFLTPDDPATDLVFTCYEDSVPAYTTGMTMTLNKAAGPAWLDGLNWVPCTVFIDTDLNQRVYHAEFEMNNGYTTGSDRVVSISLWHGWPVETNRYTLTTAEQFPKWTTTRVIVEYRTKNA